jgi:hydroxymethylglutaryl-CoA synthase
MEKECVPEVGIVGYGIYLPIYRIKISEIARVWGRKLEGGIEEKTVAGPDEDTTTMAVEAARNALKRAGINPKDIGAVYVGSESPPYAVKPTATIVAEAIEATPETMAADYEFACKAGTAALQACIGLVSSGHAKYAVAIGSDSAQCRPGDALEFTAAAGAACYIVGASSNEWLAVVEGFYSYTTDTPDFWRREGRPYPRHGGRFTGKPAYFKHVIAAAQGLMRKLNLTPQDFDFVVFHQPNFKFPLQAADELGFPPEKVQPGMVVQHIGNTYSASSLIGLAAVLDQAKAEQRILLVSYGSGAGSDAFSIRTTENLESKKSLAPSVDYYIKRKVLIDYGTYSKLKYLG